MNPKSSQVMKRHEAWMADAIKAHEGFCSAVRKAKEQAFDCGVLLLSARAEYQSQFPGEWDNYLATFKDRIGRSSAYLYMKFAQNLLEQAQQLTGKQNQAELLAPARQIVLDSPLTFVELCRQAGIMKTPEKLVNSPARAGRGGQQYWFSFDVFDDLVTSLEKQSWAPLAEVDIDKLAATREKLAMTLAQIDDLLNSRPDEFPHNHENEEPRGTALVADGADHAEGPKELGSADKADAPSRSISPEDEDRSDWPWFWGYQNRWGGTFLKPYRGADSMREIADTRMSPSAAKVVNAFQAPDLEAAEVELGRLLALEELDPQKPEPQEIGNTTAEDFAAATSIDDQEG